MATGTANSTPPPPVADPRKVGGNGVSGHGTDGYGASVERQLRQTQRQVKFVDLCTALMALAAGAVGYLLLVAVIDHWLFGLGYFGRVLALGILLVGCGWFFFTAILKLLIHRINPLYAARSIEQGTPALKNSLINFLMFRANQSAVHRVVYQAMEQKAATDLASVPVDTAVDRSKMIKVGYVLVAVLAAGAAYTILSPKDPFQTLARVAVPWQTIARPSRVVIEDVQPGTVEAVQGQFVDVAALVRGARDGKDTVSLIYSTNDGQTVERVVTMQLDENGLAYHGQLPADSAGLQHDLEYRVESGDAVSATFTVTLSPAPAILVDVIEYDFPAYTKRPQETVHDEGNIRGLEGTRVTIVATANKPIRSAAITFNPFRPSDAAQPPVTLAMDFRGTTARQTFTLALAGDRRTPVYDSYQLTFVTETGAASRQPILHQIDVVPDLAPEVEILDPTQNRITIPVSGRRKIEVRAVDPDFGLSRLKLRAVAGGTDVLDEMLFEDVSGRRGQEIATFEFVPSLLGLAAGDRVTYWAVAEDNRMSVDKDHGGGNQGAPNLARTRDYQIEIVPDPPRQGQQPGQPSASEEGQPEPSPDGPQPQPKPGDPPSEKPAETPSSGDNPPPDDPRSDPAASPDDPAQEPKEENTETEDGAGSGQSGSESGSSDGEPEQGKGGAGAPQDGQTQPGDAASSGGRGGNTPQAGGQPDAASGGQGGDPPPEQLHDGEVFEKVLKKMQEEQSEGRGQPNPNGNDAGENSGTPPGNNSDQPGSGKPSDKPSGQADDQSKPQGDASGDSQGSDTNSKPFSEDGTPRKNQAQPNQAQSKPGEGAKQPDIKRGAGDQKAGNPGEGGDTNASSGEQQGKPKPDVPGEPDQREKEPGSGDNGESGAGQNSKETEGSGSVESSQDQAVENRDKPKNGNPDSTEPQEKSDPGSTNGKKQSDSEGGESGDQSGGGKKGPGQGANQAGNDSAGQNSSADDGAGASAEAGDGESSDAAGSKQEASGKTGSSGNKKGDGSASRKDPNGNRENEGATGSSPEAEPGQENRQPQDRQDGGGGGNRPGESGLPTGGGVPSDVRHNSGLDPNLEVAEGDAANLEYSRKTTDMVIDYLKDLESRPNPELLKELGWTPEEMKQFIDRWQRLKRGAADDSGRRELDESLRSLGLRSPGSKLRQRRVQSDDQRGLSESGDVSQPPAAYRDLFDAFRKGAARVRDN